MLAQTAPRNCTLGIITSFLLGAMTITKSEAYRIGTPGKPWGESERLQWKAQCELQRSYRTEVLDKLDSLVKKESAIYVLEKYGALPCNESRYPLMAIKSQNWDSSKPCLLVTGGVHGYETSGVQGAILFLREEAKNLLPHFNILVCPCVSPWAYEHIQRWNPDVKDPNRSFKEGNLTNESKALIEYIEKNFKNKWICHLDLHETTDSDETEFRRARAAEAGEVHEPDSIPDGFYLVANSKNPQKTWHAAIIDSVRKVTHIAPPDDDGNIIGQPMTQEGVIEVDVKEYGLCMSVVDAEFATTTEVYPDSPRCTDDICNQAQVAAIKGACNFILSNVLKQ